MTYKFVIHGKIKPYVRMTQRSMYVDPQAQEYLASKMEVGRQVKQQMDGQPMSEKTPLAVSIKVQRAHKFHNSDLDNTIKAICDAMQGIVFRDDRWVDQIKAERYLGDEDVTWVFVRELG